MSLQQVGCWYKCWEEASLTLKKIQDPNYEVIENIRHIKSHLNCNSLLVNFVTCEQKKG